MSADVFVAALQDVLRQEGRFSNQANDRGGPTDYGISLRFLQSLPDLHGDLNGDGHVDMRDVQSLTPSIASSFYHRHFWDHYRLDEIVHARIAIKLFNLLVNMRSALAVRCLQRALRACQKSVIEDGVLGSATIAAVNEIQDEYRLLASMRSEAWGTYALILAADPSQEQFRNGWKNRAYS